MHVCVCTQLKIPEITFRKSGFPNFLIQLVIHPFFLYSLASVQTVTGSPGFFTFF